MQALLPTQQFSPDRIEISEPFIRRFRPLFIEDFLHPVQKLHCHAFLLTRALFFCKKLHCASFSVLCGLECQWRPFLVARESPANMCILLPTPPRPFEKPESRTDILFFINQWFFFLIWIRKSRNHRLQSRFLPLTYLTTKEYSNRFYQPFNVVHRGNFSHATLTNFPSIFPNQRFSFYSSSRNFHSIAW